MIPRLISQNILPQSLLHFNKNGFLALPESGLGKLLTNIQPGVVSVDGKLRSRRWQRVAAGQLGPAQS